MSALSYQFKKDFNEFDASKKDYDWYNRLVREFRNFMEPLVTKSRAKVNRDYLNGTQDVAKYRKKFAKPDDMPFEFVALGVFEKTRDILSAEREKAGIYLQLNALDPTAQEEREYDKKLLENSTFIEQMLSYAQLSIGLPAYQISKDKQIEGEKIAKGNLESFKDLGLDPNSPEDIAYFFKTHYRLDVEMDGEAAVNHFVRINELQETLKEWCDDVMAVKALAGRVYADEVTHIPTYKYIAPENIRWIKGQRRDGKDAKAIMVEEDLTISDFLGRVGSQVTRDNIEWLLECANYHNGTKYDGLAFSNGYISQAGCTNACNYDMFMNLKVGTGYVEFKSIDIETRKVGKNSLGNTKIWQVPNTWEPGKESAYVKDQVWNVVTHKTYFVTKSIGDQVLFKWGKLFDQVTYGAEDEYSAFSFQVYKQPGQSAIEIARPFIDNIHDAWYRFNWMLNKAKPKGTRYNYNVMAKIGRSMFKEDSEKNGVMKVIKMFQESIDDFYVNDVLNPQVGGGQNPHFDKPNGLDASVKEIYQIFMDQQALISDKLGINAVREAYSPSPNDGYKLQMQTLAQSRNATEYMSRMIMSVLENFAKHTLSIVQDMIEFKGKSYDVIERAIGFRAVGRLQALKKVPLHKFGIFVESFNTDIEKQEQKKEATDAWQKGEIPYHVYMLIKAIDNPKKAAQVLAYEKGKEYQRKIQEQKMLHDQKMQEIEAQGKVETAKIAAEKDMKMAVQDLTNQGIIRVAEISNQMNQDLKDKSINSEPMKAGVRARAKIRQDEAAARIKKGEPAETADI